MPAVTRLGDKCTGHDCFPARASTEGSPSVFIEGISVHRLGDAWASHSCPDKSPHTGILASGSSSVYANGLAIGRIGDLIDCGSRVAVGAANVFAG